MHIPNRQGKNGEIRIGGQETGNEQESEIGGNGGSGQ